MNEEQPEQEQLLNQEELLHIIGPGGELSKTVPNFEYREGQYNLLNNIIHTFNHKGYLVSEAGTGIGKSMAYLIPAIYSNQKVVVSTNTKALQDQLYNKDIPNLLRALNKKDVIVGLAKGKSNFVCIKKVTMLLEDENMLITNDEKAFCQEVMERKDSDIIGFFIDFNEVSNEIQNKTLCDNVCTRSKCSFFENCFYYRNKQQLRKADIIICNHYLLACDLTIKTKTSFTSEKALPAFKTLIIDEAHHIENVVLRNMSRNFTLHGVMRLLGHMTSSSGMLHKLDFNSRSFYYKRGFTENALIDIVKPLIVEVTKAKEPISRHFETIRKQISQCSSGYKFDYRVKAQSWQEPQMKDVSNSLNQIIDHLTSIHDDLYKLENIIDRDKVEEYSDTVTMAIIDFQDTKKECNNILNTIKDFLVVETSEYTVKWVSSEGQGRPLRFHHSPLTASELLKEHLYPNLNTCILLSATMAINNKFNYTLKRLGLENPPEERHVWTYLAESPFDYEKNARLVLPYMEEDPNHQNFISKISGLIKDMCIAIQGRTFVLFTSFKSLRECYRLISTDLKEAGLIPMSQLEHQKEILLTKYKTTQGAVLFGTSTFWEGVDVPGDKLQCVIIEKIPFPMFKEPLTEARMELIDATGGNSFMSYMIPEAIMRLKQGAGRLIRTKTDRGVIVLFDNRIYTKRSYGGLFIASLPKMHQIAERFEEALQGVKDFFEISPLSGQPNQLRD